MLVTGLFAAAATYSLGAMLFGHTVGLRSSALLYSTAVVGWLSGTAYVDNGLMFFLTVAVLAFLNWQETGDRVWLAITALLDWRLCRNQAPGELCHSRHDSGRGVARLATCGLA